MAIRTRIFELAPSFGYETLSALARAMDCSPGYLGRVSRNERSINQKFITGALRAFPGKAFDDLFVIEPTAPGTEPARALTNSDEILTRR